MDVVICDRDHVTVYKVDIEGPEKAGRVYKRQR